MNKINVFLNKKSVNNGIWMYLLQFFNTVVPLLTLPYITRILGASHYGTFSVALNIVTYLQVVVDYGFSMSATRKVALSGGNNLNKLFTAVLFSRLILLFISIIITLIYILFHFDNYELCISLFLLLTSLIGYCTQVNWIFQGKQDMKYISAINIIARTVMVVGIFSFVKTTDDLFLYCILYSISPIIGGFIGLGIIRYKYNIKIIQIKTEDIKKEFVEGWYVFTTQLSSKVFGAIGITFLGIFSTPVEVGIFSAIQKIPAIMILVWSPIAQVLYPMSSMKMEESWEVGKMFIRKIQKYVLPIFIAGALAISFSARSLILLLFGSEYQQFYYWIIPLVIGIVIAVNNNFLGVQILLASGNDKKYSRSFQIGLGFTILTNFIFIFFFKGNGAAFAPMVSEFILGVLLHLEINKIDR